MSNAPASRPSSPAAGPPPGGFNLEIQPDFSRRCFKCVCDLGQEVHSVFQHYAQVAPNPEAAVWLQDFREDLRIIYDTWRSDAFQVQDNLFARVRAKFKDYDGWRRGLGPAPWV